MKLIVRGNWSSKKAHNCVDYRQSKGSEGEKMCQLDARLKFKGSEEVYAGAQLHLKWTDDSIYPIL